MAKVEGIEEIYIRLLSQIGTPIDYPLVASVQVLPGKDYEITSMKSDVEAIVNEGLATVTCVTERVINGEIRTF